MTTSPIANLTEIAEKVRNAKKVPQLAVIAGEIQDLAIRLSASLVSDGEAALRIAEAEKRSRDMIRALNFDPNDQGKRMFVGTLEFDPQALKLVLNVPACAGMTEGPFLVTSTEGRVVDDALEVEITIRWWEYD